MKKIIKVVVYIVLLGLSFSSAQAEVSKEDLFARITQKYSGVESISGKYEINMTMMGNIMKIPVSFWQKGNKVRMDMTMNQPGMTKPMEQSMLIDGQKVIQYQKMLNTVMTVDLNKLPENMRRQIGKQQGFMMNSDTINQLYQMIDKIVVEEKVKDGKSFYLITVKDIANAGNISQGLGMQGTQQIFKKFLLWINPSSLFPEKMELYGDADTPGMWIDFLEISTDPVSDSIFKLDIPADAKYIDITESFQHMMENVK